MERTHRITCPSGPSGPSRPSVVSPAPMACVAGEYEVRRCGNALMAALSSGILTGDPRLLESVFDLATRLGGDTEAHARAVARLYEIARSDEPAACAVLAGLGSAAAAERLAGLIANPALRVAARVAAVRGALFVLREGGELASGAEAALLRALHGAQRADETTLAAAAAFVRASLGLRDARGVLERGLLEAEDTPTLRLCLLGLDRIGDTASLPFVWRVWTRCPTLRTLAESVVDHLERSLEREPVDDDEEDVETLPDVYLEAEEDDVRMAPPPLPAMVA